MTPREFERGFESLQAHPSIPLNNYAFPIKDRSIHDDAKNEKIEQVNKSSAMKLKAETVVQYSYNVFSMESFHPISTPISQPDYDETTSSSDRVGFHTDPAKTLNHSGLPRDKEDFTVGTTSENWNMSYPTGFTSRLFITTRVSDREMMN